MLRHVVLIKFKEETTAEAIKEMEQGFASLAANIPEVRAMSFGDDLGMADGNFDYAMCADFDSRESWLAYQQHPEHLAFAQSFKDLASAACRVQYALNGER